MMLEGRWTPWVHLPLLIPQLMHQHTEWDGQIKPPNGRFVVLLSTGRKGPLRRRSNSET